MSDVIIKVGVDTTEVDSSIEATAAKADEVVKTWATQRRTIMSQVREAMSNISSLISSFREAISLMGAQIDPFFDVILGMVSATISMLLAVAAAYSATIIGAPWAIVIAAIALGLSAFSFGQTMASKAILAASFADMNAKLSMAGQRSPLGGSF